jgi:hypothetical protein
MVEGGCDVPGYCHPLEQLKVRDVRRLRGEPKDVTREYAGITGSR